MRRYSFIKRFIYYFGWTVAIGFIILIGTEYQVQIEQKANRNFQVMPIVSFAILFPIMIGLLLRLPKFIIELKENKRWSFDWVKFIAIALPCVCILSISILPFSSLGVGTIKIPSIIMLGSPTLQIISGIVFGYTFLDSLLK